MQYKKDSARNPESADYLGNFSRKQKSLNAIPFKIISTIVVLGLIFNIYKIKLALIRPYYIFPWSVPAAISKTTPLMLEYHICTALTLLLVAALRNIIPAKNKWMNILFTTCHYAFILGIIPNIFHFGDNSNLTAFILNGGLLLMLQLAYHLAPPLTYFLILSIPILFEVFLFSIEWIPIFLYYFFNCPWVLVYLFLH